MQNCAENMFDGQLYKPRTVTINHQSNPLETMKTLRAALIAMTCAAALLLTSSLEAQTYAFTNFAGLPGGVGNVDGIGSAARFNQPGAVAVDSAGNVYVADSQNHTIRKITPGGVVTTLAGSAGQD